MKFGNKPSPLHKRQSRDFCVQAKPPPHIVNLVCGATVINSPFFAQLPNPQVLFK